MYSCSEISPAWYLASASAIYDFARSSTLFKSSRSNLLSFLISSEMVSTRIVTSALALKCFIDLTISAGILLFICFTKSLYQLVIEHTIFVIYRYIATFHLHIDSMQLS